MQSHESNAVGNRIHASRQAFESEWQSGSQPNIVEYLRDWQGSQRSELLRHLVDVDRRYRTQSDRLASIEYYQEILPDHIAELSEVFSVGSETLVQSDAATSIASENDDTHRTQLTQPAVDDLQNDPLVSSGHLGRYEIVRVLGIGGMGTVYLANDTQLDRKVALKVPTILDLDDTESLARFTLEARSAAALHHPNICPVFDVGVADGQHYITMAYIDGETLAESIRRTGNQSDQYWVADQIRKLATGLAEAHQAGIVHRDLKPGNVILDQRGEPILMDFGLARCTEHPDATRLTHSGSILGTPAYMSPEQVKSDGSPVGPPSDIYSLGVVLYQWLTAELPFTGDMLSILLKITDSPAPNPIKLRPDLDPRLGEICLKMMAKQPSDRYPSMQSVAQALQVVVDSQVESTTAKQSMASTMPGATIDLPAAAELAQASAKTLTKGSAMRGGSPPNWISGKALAAGGAAMALVLTAIIMYVKIDDQHVKLTVDESISESTSVRTDGKSLIVDGPGEPIEVSTSNDKLMVRRDGMKVATDKVSIEENGNEVIRIEQAKGLSMVEPANIALVKPRKKKKPKRQDPKPKQSDTTTAEKASAEKTPAKPQAVPKPAPKPTPRPPYKVPKGKLVAAEGGLSVELLNTMLGHSNWTQDVTYSPDGNLLASCGIDGRIVIWDAHTGQQKRSMSNFGQGVDTGNTGVRVSEISFSPDSQRLAAVGSPSRVAIYDCESGEMVRSLPEQVPTPAIVDNRLHSIIAVAYSTRADLLITGDTQERMQVWNPTSGEQGPLLNDHFGDVWKIRFSRDGKHFASSSWDGTARIWDAKTLELIHTLKCPDSTVYAITFSADDTKLYTGGNGTKLIEWDVATGKRLREVGGHLSRILSASASSDGRWIATVTGTNDDAIQIDDAVTGKRILEVLDTGHKPGTIACSPTDPLRFATAGYDKTVRLWKIHVAKDGQASKPIRKLDPPGMHVVRHEVGHDHLSITPWQSFKATADGTITKIDLQPVAYGGRSGHLRIYEGTGTKGKQLHEQPFELASVSGSPWRPFELTQPIDVVNGKTYTWELQGARGMRHSKNDAYPDGQASSRAYDLCFRVYIADKAKP